jgi:DNA polymerase II small subunit
MNKQEIINKFMEKGYLISPDFLDVEFDEEFFNLINEKIISKDKPIVINKDLFHVIKNNGGNIDINWLEFEKSKSFYEKGRNGKIYQTFLDILNYNINPLKKEQLNIILEQVEKQEENLIIEKPQRIDSNIMILKSFNEDSKKRETKDFVGYFKARYENIRKILQNRIELQKAVSINRLIGKNTREMVSTIGLVYTKQITKNGNILLTLEDPTGYITVLVNKNRDELFKFAKDLTLDEVIGVMGVLGDKIIFTTSIILPDAMINGDVKKTEDEVYAAFISDLHIGSVYFLAEDFGKFVKWLNGSLGSFKQRKIAKNLKYLFVIGDLIDGVGIYPGQDQELVINDIVRQYDKCAELLSQIRQDINIIICPGNHDALRISVPQPVLDKEFARSLYKLPNVTMVSNPGYVNIHSSPDFSGYDILMYHGYSFHYYVDNIESLRQNNARDNPNLILKYLLQRRHLAPTHGSALYVPDIEKDNLVIEKIPDIIVTGEMHRSDISTYNNIITINCSCWQSKTDFQEKTGNNPDPGKVPIINLKTREINMLKFSKEA